MGLSHSNTGEGNDLSQAAISKVVNDLWADVTPTIDPSRAAVAPDPPRQAIAPDQDVFALEIDKQKHVIRSWPELMATEAGRNGQYSYFCRKADDPDGAKQMNTSSKHSGVNKLHLLTGDRDSAGNKVHKLRAEPVAQHQHEQEQGEGKEPKQESAHVKRARHVYVVPRQPTASATTSPQNDRIFFVASGTVDFTPVVHGSSKGTGSAGTGSSPISPLLLPVTITPNAFPSLIMTP